MKPSAFFRSARPEWLSRVVEASRPYRMLLGGLVGLGVGWSILQVTVTRPLTREVIGLHSELSDLTARMDQLVAVRDVAYQAQDLLSALEAQRQTLAAAHESLTAIRELRGEIEQESRQTAEAMVAMQQLAALQSNVLAAGREAAVSQNAVQTIADLNSRLAALEPRVQASLAGVVQTDKVVSRLDQLQQQLIDSSAELTQAEEVVTATRYLHRALAEAAPAAETAAVHTRELVQLTTDLNSVNSTGLTAAHDHAADLLALHDILSNAEAMRLADAERNLRSMLDTQAALAGSTPHVVTAAENLDLLCEFQTELSVQLQSVEELRRDLIEITLLKETVSRVQETMRPLADLSNLRRLDPADVRALAREILDRRTAQLPTLNSSALPLQPVSAPASSNERPVPTPVDLLP